MSRTKRRKHVKYEKGWGDRSYLVSRGVIEDWLPGCYSSDASNVVPDPEHYQKYCKARYHSDSRQGFGWNGNVPSSWRRVLRTAVRAKDKAVTRDILKKGIYEEYSYVPWKSDAGYDYW